MRFIILAACVATLLFNGVLSVPHPMPALDETTTLGGNTTPALGPPTTALLSQPGTNILNTQQSLTQTGTGLGTGYPGSVPPNIPTTMNTNMAQIPNVQPALGTPYPAPGITNPQLLQPQNMASLYSGDGKTLPGQPGSLGSTLAPNPMTVPGPQAMTEQNSLAKYPQTPLPGTTTPYTNNANVPVGPSPDGLGKGVSSPPPAIPYANGVTQTALGAVPPVPPKPTESGTSPKSATPVTSLSKDPSTPDYGTSTKTATPAAGTSKDSSTTGSKEKGSTSPKSTSKTGPPTKRRKS